MRCDPNADVGEQLCRSFEDGDGPRVSIVDALPQCVLLSMANMLSPQDLCSLARVDRACQTIATDSQVWCKMITRRFEPVSWALPTDVLTPAPGTSFRDHYFFLNQRFLQLAAAPHSKEDSCWIVIGKHVCDVTEFMHEHPGMAQSLMLFAGGDASDVFLEVSHSPAAIERMESLRVPHLHLPDEGCPFRLLERRRTDTDPQASTSAIESLAKQVYIRFANDAEHMYSNVAAEEAAHATANAVEAAAEAVGGMAEALRGSAEKLSGSYVAAAGSARGAVEALRESWAENSPTRELFASATASSRILSGSYSRLRDSLAAAAPRAAPSYSSAASSAAAALSRLLGPPAIEGERISARVRARLVSAIARSKATIPSRAEVHEALELYFGSAEEAAVSLDIAFHTSADAADTASARSSTASVLSGFKRRTTRELLGSLEAYFGEAMDDHGTTFSGIGSLLRGDDAYFIGDELVEEPPTLEKARLSPTECVQDDRDDRGREPSPASASCQDRMSAEVSVGG